ncbi:MAG: hypothetical protein ACRCT8_13040 [Lacipirellulaceae bacterium]
MMTLSSGVLALLVAVNYGWQPADPVPSASQDEAGYEYLVQVGPDDVRALQEGRAAELSSAIPPGVGPVDRVRIVLGEGPVPQVFTRTDALSPKRIAAEADSATRQEVAKPVVPDWLAPRATSGPPGPQPRTAFQNPQNFDGLTRGFEQAFAQQPQAPAGSVDPLKPLADGAKDLAQATGQSLQDLGEGARDMVSGVFNGARQTAEGAVDAVGNVATNTANVGNDPYFAQRNAPAPPQQSTITPLQYQDQQRRPETLYPGLVPTAQSTAGQQQSAANQQGYQPLQSLAQPNTQGVTAGRASGYYRDGATGREFYYNAETNQSQWVQEPLSDPNIATNFAEAARMTPVQRPTTVADTRTAAAGTTGNPFGDWPWPGSTPPATQPTQTNYPAAPAATNTWPNSTSPAAQPQPNTVPLAGAGVLNGNGQNYGSNPGNDTNGWGGQNGAGNNAIDSQREPPLGDRLLWGVLMVGSLAFSLFVGSNYLDIRNKYRAALRRGPSVYQQAA